MNRLTALLSPSVASSDRLLPRQSTSASVAGSVAITAAGRSEQPVARDIVATMVEAGDDAGPPAWMPDFWVSDTEGAAVKAEELGGSVLSPPRQSPVGKSAVLADPAGATFSVSQLSGG